MAALTDRPLDIFGFIHEGMVNGHQCALVTLVEIIDGASRALGTHMAVCDDGRYCGFVSGGCIEAAVAREALDAIAAGRDRICRFGKGSPYFDIVLPCGGGVSLAIHVLKDMRAINSVIRTLKTRGIARLAYDPAREELFVCHDLLPIGWQSGCFISVYQPDTQILLAGNGIEAQTFRSIASAAGLNIIQGNPEIIHSLADRETAIVVLLHDVDKELPVLRAALYTNVFYIGCLGSRRTHAKRITLLLQEGYSREEIDRIRAPIGLFGPAREARSVAVSVLAEVLSLAEINRQQAPEREKKH